MHDHPHTHQHEGHQPLEYEAWVAQYRRDKDAFFRGSPQSPIPPKEQPGFSGLAYYPVDPAWRFESLSLAPLADGLAVETLVQTSDGTVRQGRRVGTLHFEAHGVPQRLTALRLAGSHGAALFVPLADATSGSETYAAGRYLDVEPNPDGSYDLDFNLAYAPFCAYSPQYSCPLPPQENRLSVAVRAGERNP